MKKMSVTPKQLFLIDNLGGLLSTLLLGVVLVRFKTAFGMPLHVLYTLSCIACVYVLLRLPLHKIDFCQPLPVQVPFILQANNILFLTA
jgi:hypothetical protein